MSMISIEDPSSAQRYIESVELPAAFKKTRSETPRAPIYTTTGQAVAVGSQIAEFAANVPAALRPHIANSFLLAQLAANSYIKKVGGGHQRLVRAILLRAG